MLQFFAIEANSLGVFVYELRLTGFRKKANLVDDLDRMLFAGLTN